MTKVKRLDPKERKAQVLAAALHVAARDGYTQMQRADIAARAKVSPARVSQLFNTMPQLRRAVMRHAVKVENHKVIAQGLAANDKHAIKAPENVKRAAVEAML